MSHSPEPTPSPEPTKLAPTLQSKNIRNASFQAIIDSSLSMIAFSDQQLKTIPPISLAYIGDAVFELYVRSRLLMPTKRIRDYHQVVVNHVKAEQQACYSDALLPHLNETERDMLRRGRNATTGRNRRGRTQDYQKSTGFETLIGFLYLSDQDRLVELLQQLDI